mmetsp:Transcript_65861/g.122905  ORF Transcript_65861/g.122905 Transcript_65861/m.122905 type:complete len:513 (-) Transcript_65861:90-1628(-)
MSQQSQTEFGKPEGSSVCIIGAGPSGLAACKAALEEGLHPTVLEKSQDVGGLYRQDGSGKVWESMVTSSSKYTCAFSDMPWAADAQIFPSSGNVHEYLRAFAQKFDLLKHVQFGKAVQSVEPLSSTGKMGSNGWKVTWKMVGATRTVSRIFLHVIAATGFFEVGHLPSLPGLSTFTGDVIHSSNYKNPAPFKNKNVLVAGGAFSGADIAAETSSVATSVTIAAPRPVWYIPRFIKGKPLDLVLYSRATQSRSSALPHEQQRRERHNELQSMCRGKGYPESVPVPDVDKDLPYFVITDRFLGSVHSGKVTVETLAVKELDHKDVIFSDGSRKSFDVVIFATGYRVALPYLPSQVKDILEFDGDDWLQPVILQETVWRPELENIAFVGLYRGPFFAVMELQARWAIGVFSGRLSRPAGPDALEALKHERAIRQQQPRPQFPHGNYVELAETLARWVGVHPQELMDAEHTDPTSVREQLRDGPLLPFHYRLVGFCANPSVAIAAIQECQGRYSAL